MGAGDRVTVSWGTFSQDMRITGFAVEITEAEEKLTPALEVV